MIGIGLFALMLFLGWVFENLWFTDSKPAVRAFVPNLLGWVVAAALAWFFAQESLVLVIPGGLLMFVLLFSLWHYWRLRRSWSEDEDDAEVFE